MQIAKLSTIAAAMLSLGVSAPTFAQTPEGSELVKKVADQLGIELGGYARAGFYPKTDTKPAGGYALGGKLQKYRLGNEGDNYAEILVGKVFNLGNGVKWGAHWMPNVNEGTTGTAQLYMDVSGMDIFPEASFWAGQRFHRLEDIHIVDHQMFEDGDNYGFGVDNINVGFGKLNAAAYTAGTFDNHNANPNRARRLSVQWHDMPVNPGGKLTLTGSIINGDFAQGSSGSAWGVRHNQAFGKEFNNSLFLQTSSGHADINGKFYGLDSTSSATVITGATLSTLTLSTVSNTTTQAGAKQNMIADSVNWQYGKFGGQALIGYNTIKPEGGSEVKDFSLGGRVSYGIAAHTKLLGEVGITSRTGAGAKQTLNKETIALALSPNVEFWSRPEVRFYVTHANWNDAAATANASSFGVGGRTSDTIVGMQVEAWW